METLIAELQKLFPTAPIRTVTFEQVMNNKLCPPFTLQEFVDYVREEEKCVEIVVFDLWYREYKRLFERTSIDVTMASAQWAPGSAEAKLAIRRFNNQKAKDEGKRDGRFFCNSLSTEMSIIPPSTAASGSTAVSGSTMVNRDDVPVIDLKIAPFAAYKDIPGPDITYATSNAMEAFDVEGIPKPVAGLPFQDVINRVITTYIANDSPRQLNISDKQRYLLLSALSTTTHPSAFAAVAHEVERGLKAQSYTNFVKTVGANGNRARILFATSLGIGLIVGAAGYYVVAVLAGWPMGCRAIMSIPLFLGISTLYASLKGLCVVLHGLGRRQLKPWELYQDLEAGQAEEEYKKRSIFRKIFDKELLVVEEGVRRFHDEIFLRSLILAAAVTAVVTVVLTYGPPMVKKF